MRPAPTACRRRSASGRSCRDSCRRRSIVAKLSRIELIIARDGSVESAKLLGNRRDVQGGMFLSAAKSWQFRPATKDGVAVRYRKTILVSFE